MEEILTDISFSISEGEHVALVGPNGVGKTMLLNVIAGIESVDSGEVILPSDTSIAYIPQSADEIFEDVGDLTILNYVLHSRGLLEIENRMHYIEEIFENGESDSIHLLSEYGELQRTYEIRGGYDLEYMTRKVLSGLGFVPSINLKTKVSELSVGEKAKLFIAQVLLSDANLLLLDEPSSHLDKESSLWLACYLSNLDKSVVTISHDPDFLDFFVSRVLVLGKYKTGILDFRGNYTDYLEQDERLLITNERVLSKNKKELERLDEMANRFRAGVNARKAKDREKKATKIIQNMGEKGQKKYKIKSVFKVENPSSQEVLKINGLVKGFPGNRLDYSNLNLEVRRGEKIAVQGAVGSGKSTLLKMIAGFTSPDSGEIKLGYKVDIGYYAQELENLDKSLSVIEELSRTNMTISEQALRNHLATFMFREDDIFKSVSVLSYGERSRLSLAKLALQGHNFLLLDEPTNHLDFDSRSALAEMLEKYDGTLLVVSHDSEFLEGINLDKKVLLPSGKISYI